MAELDGRTLHLSMPTSGLARKVEEAGNADVLKAALREILGVDWTIRCQMTVPGDGAPPESASSGARRGDPAPERSTSAPGWNGSGSGPRPAGAAAGLPAAQPDDEIPDDYDDPDAARQAGPVIDPEQAAIELLAAQLGARPLDPEA